MSPDMTGMKPILTDFIHTLGLFFHRKLFSANINKVLNRWFAVR